MKHILCSLGIIAAFCLGYSNPIFCQSVTSSEAQKMAITFMKAQKPGAQIITNSGVENRGEQPLIYTFNFLPGGFVLVAGDKKSSPILGFSKENNFDTEKLNPEASFYLNELKSQISYLKNRTDLPSMQASWDQVLTSSAAISAESDFTVGPFLTTKWDQGQYYNQNCPAAQGGVGGHVYTGCVATAMAQLLKFHNSPAYGTDIHAYNHAVYGWQLADFGNTKYNWTNMPNMLTTYNPDVATLMYQCGVAVDMDYGVSGSSAATAAIGPAFQNYFSFSSSMQWITAFLEGGNFPVKIQADLDLGHPTFMTGCSSFTGEACHAWLCDGYQSVPGLPTFYDMNWGWGGSQNGYYAMGNFNTGTYSFDWHLTAITGLVPSCMRNVNITTAPIAGLPILEAIETITTNMPAVPFAPALGKLVFYDAGKYIQMNPGFLADANQVLFRAYIQGCGGHVPPVIGESEDRIQTEKSITVPKLLELNVHPNPFNNSTMISYGLPTDEVVDIQIFNIMGNIVAQPILHESQSAGSHEYNFEAADLPTGVYFLVMRMGTEKQTKRLVVTR